MNSDIVEGWHGMLGEIEESHRRFAKRILAIIQEYEKTHAITTNMEYDGDGTIRMEVYAGGASWELEVTE